MIKRTMVMSCIILCIGTGYALGATLDTYTSNNKQSHPDLQVSLSYDTLDLPFNQLEAQDVPFGFVDFSTTKNAPALHLTEKLTEPFFVPFQRLSDGKSETYTYTEFYTPTGKVIDVYFPDNPEKIMEGGLGYYQSLGAYKFQEYVIFDKLGNTRRIATFHDSFVQVNNQWFIYSVHGLDRRLYNAKTNTWIPYPEDMHVPPYENNHPHSRHKPINAASRKLLDIQHLPYYDLKTRKMGLRNLQGTVSCIPLFDEYIDYENGVHRVKINNLTYFMDHFGKVLLKPSRDYQVESNIYGNAFVVSGLKNQNRFYYLMDSNGKITSSTYLYITPLYDGTFLALYKDGAGYQIVRLTDRGKPIIQPILVQLRGPEEIKQIQYTGSLYHVYDRILASDSKVPIFASPHELRGLPTHETVNLAYEHNGEKRVGVFTHSGKEIYSIQVK